MAGLTRVPLGMEGMSVSLRVIRVLKRLPLSLSLLPFLSVGTLRGGRDSRPPISLLEGGGKVGPPLGSFHEVVWEVSVPKGCWGC